MKLDALVAAARTAAVLSDNKNLPELPAWKARSFWLTLITAAVALANGAGIDLLAVFRDMGLGATPAAVVDSGVRGIGAVQELIPVVTGVWAWLERRAPNFRLVFWKPRAGAAA